MEGDLLLQLIVYSQRLIPISRGQCHEHTIVVVPASANVEGSSSLVELSTGIADQSTAFDLTELDLGFPQWDVPSREEVPHDHPILVDRNDELAGPDNDRQATERPGKVDQRWIEGRPHNRRYEKERNTNDDEARGTSDYNHAKTLRNQSPSRSTEWANL